MQVLTSSLQQADCSSAAESEIRIWQLLFVSSPYLFISCQSQRLAMVMSATPSMMQIRRDSHVNSVFTPVICSVFD